MERRDFLKTLSLLPAISCGPSLNQITPLKKSDKIIVIGAGLAGLSCARILATEGFDVEILEARDRIGGRVHTKAIGGREGVDFGGSYLHGGPENPLRRFFKAHDFSVINHADVEVFLSSDQQINLYNYRDYWTEVDMKLEEVAAIPYMLAYLRSFSSLPFPVTNLQEMIDRTWSKLAQHPLKNVAGEDFLHELSNQFFGVEASELSLSNLLIEPEVDISGHGPFPAGEVISRIGLAPMMEILAKNLKIQLKTVVKKIQKSGDSYQLSIEKDGQISELKADHIVMAVPLSCYKKKMIELDFPLIKEWTQAFKGLEISHLNKIVLVFKEAFWSNDSQSLFLKSSTGKGGAFYQNLLFHQGAPILIAFKSGLQAKACDLKTDEELVASELELLKSFFPETSIDLSMAEVSRWGRNEFSGGAFSHLGMQAYGCEHSAFQNHLMEKFWVAGEFAHPTDPGTMHGAYLSGQWVARKMLSQLDEG